MSISEELTGYEEEIREVMKLARIETTSARAAYWGGYDWRSSEIVVSVNLRYHYDRDNALAALSKFGGCKRTEWAETPEDHTIFVRGYWAREDPWKCPGCGWASHECDCRYPCRDCFQHDGVPLPMTRQRLLEALQQIEDGPDRGSLPPDLDKLAADIWQRMQ
jgi:hypothetical protein